MHMEERQANVEPTKSSSRCIGRGNTSGYGACRLSTEAVECHTCQDDWQHTLHMGSAIRNEEHVGGALGDVVGHGPGQDG